ncbi:MAG: heterotetrameric sarcosine oxidase delta subunit [Gammaproteobacteria bacterium]|jgi:heterotetrameric sarcosine oxidase delta subunit
MIINHPLLGPRDSSEFIYLGDACLLDRPSWKNPNETAEERERKIQEYHDYLYLRENKAGLHRELWYHEQGDRSWLVVTRDTTTHLISAVELAKDVALKQMSNIQDVEVR